MIIRYFSVLKANYKQIYNINTTFKKLCCKFFKLIYTNFPDTSRLTCACNQLQILKIFKF